MSLPDVTRASSETLPGVVLNRATAAALVNLPALQLLLRMAEILEKTGNLPDIPIPAGGKVRLPQLCGALLPYHLDPPWSVRCCKRIARLLKHGGALPHTLCVTPGNHRFSV